jgi:hypothetical protein
MSLQPRDFGELFSLDAARFVLHSKRETAPRAFLVLLGLSFA